MLPLCYDSWSSTAEASLVTEYFDRIDAKPQDDMDPRTCAGTPPLYGVSSFFDREARRRRTTLTMMTMTRTDSVTDRPTDNTTVTDV